MKYGSRKFIIMIIMVVINIVLPIVYKLLEIDPSITLASMGSISTLSGLYFGVNYFQHKLEFKNE